MDIIKRNGVKEKYNGSKIRKAIKASFHSAKIKIEEKRIKSFEENVRKILEEFPEKRVVEKIQDLVEITLMKEPDAYEAVKHYILYREQKSKKRATRNLFLNEFKEIDLNNILKKIEINYPEEIYDLKNLHEKFETFKKENMSDMEKLDLIIKAACELTSQIAPKWEYIASYFLINKYYLKLEKTLKEKNINSFYEKIQYMTNEDLYGKYILENYSKDDIDYFESIIQTERDDLLTYSSLQLLLTRYVIKTKSNVSIETPQEMFMGIAMHLGMKEKGDKRREFVSNMYDILSSLKVTMATPTMSNSRKPYHQLSSCFIDTVPDSLNGIYRSITNFAKVSKMGGGMGLYFGKVRATGSDIRGFKNAAGGVVRWIRLVNDTAVAVDQLGMRQGAVAVYLDVWHRDLPEFLQLKTTNGDDRMKAHDIFPAVCFPDLFWDLAKNNIEAEWNFMCPHEIKTIMGFSLEDYYGNEWKEKYYKCVNDHRITKRKMIVKDIIRLLLKSIVETGTPFVFNRDTVNKYNTNPQTGIIYCSNLCTEIAQTMNPIKENKKEIKEINGETIVIEETISGDFVVCNLASLVLGNMDVSNEKEIEYVVSNVVRALDNVIDLNYYPLEYAKITNSEYRAIGLGTSGYHHMLAKNSIKWESEEHLEFVDKLFEKINYYAIKTSCDLAKEKGRYKKFEGSDWSNGNYFKKRNYKSDKWENLKNDVINNGIRNAYLLAIAPTSSTSIIAGTTAGIDPIMNKYFLEEKKGAIVPRVAPDLSIKTMWFYKSAHTIDQTWSIKACGIRQKHIDQAQSMNLYITNDYTLKQILNLYLQAWENGLKTVYYSRSKSLEVEECESCFS